jgi:RND family efflux transporter MFP subunit
MKKYWIIFGVIGLAALIGWFYFISPAVTDNSGIYKVQKEDLQETISEVGTVVPVKEVDLTFPISGRIAQISVAEGQFVKKGDIMAKVDTSRAEASLASAQASVQEAQSRLDKAYSGATIEDVRVSETAVENAQKKLNSLRATSDKEIASTEANINFAEITLANAQDNFEKQQEKSNEDVRQIYEDALDAIRDANTKSDTAIKTMSYIQGAYFTLSSNEDRAVKDEKKRSENSFKNLQPIIQNATMTDIETISLATDEVLTTLNQISSSLGVIRGYLEDTFGISPSKTDTGYIDAERTSIDAAITSITVTKQAISSAQLTQNITLGSAEAAVESAEAALKQAEASLNAIKAQRDSSLSLAEGELRLAQDQLALKRAGAHKSDITLYRAQVNQALAYVDVIRQDLIESTLYSPTDGTVTKVFSEIGELASPSRPIVSLISEGNFQIEAYISELDVASLDIGDPAEMDFDAFGSSKMFTGHLITIDPFETIVDGDIYYKVTIQLDQYDEGIRSGMTVNIKILTAEKKNILVVPSRYIGEEADVNYVKVYADAVNGEMQYEVVEVETGVRGTEKTEIISGLKEGQKIIPYY